MSRRLQRTGLAGVVVLLAALVVASTASAYEVARRAGRPGVVRAKKLVGYNYFGQAPYVTWPSGKIYRSPAAPRGLQHICARYKIMDWNYTYGAWYVWAISPSGRADCWDIRRGQYLTMPSIPHSGGTDFGRYRGVWSITWYAQTWSRIGSLLLDFKDEGDYTCGTTKCRIFYSSPQDRYFLFFPG